MRGELTRRMADDLVHRGPGKPEGVKLVRSRCAVHRASVEATIPLGKAFNI